MIRAVLCGVLAAVSALSLLVVSIEAAPAFMPEPLTPIDVTVSDETVPMIHCYGEFGGGTGTGVRVGPTLVLTAAHVASIGLCMIDGEVAQPVKIDPELDYAILRTSPHSKWFPVACDRLEFGDSYEAIGYANGGPIYRQEVFGTLTYPISRKILPGFGDTGVFVGRERFIPGMSGGPIFRRSDGHLIGLVIGFHKIVKVSYGRFLADTEVCRNA